MKILNIISLFIFFSCENNTVENKFQNNGVVGKWQMVEYCFSPGDPTCPIQKVEKNKGQVVEFQADGKFTVIDAPNKINAIECGGEWKKEDDSKLNIVLSCESLIKKRDLFYKLADKNQLYLYGRCIEECRFVFEPIK
jgi:hypothetical protein